MQTLLQDLRYGARMLMKKPGWALIAILTLALGIGANTAIFSVVNGLLLRALPYRDAARLVSLGQSNRQTGAAREGVSPANFLDWREQARSFEGIAAAEQFGFTLTGEGEPEALRGWVVTKGFFDILGTNALLGRTLLPEEYEPGQAQVVVLSHALWQRRFGGNPQVIGRKLTFNEQLFTVVGVMPPGFQYPPGREPPGRELWAPREPRPSDPQNRGGSLFRVIGRIQPSVTVEQAQQEMNGIAARLSQQYPQTNTGVGAVVVSLREQLVGQVRLALYVLFGAVSLVLLIACANVASLLLLRATERQREFALRAALGAGNWRLRQQLFLESLLLAVPGGLGGLLLSSWLIELIISLSPSNLPLQQIRLNLSVLLFATGISLLTAVIFGLAPAWQVARNDLQTVLKEGGRTETAGRGRLRFRQALVVTEIALALIVLVGAGLLLRSFRALLQTDPGFRTDHGLAFEIQLGRRPAAERIVFFDQVLEKVSALPGVQAVAVSSALPFHDNQVALQTVVKLVDRPASLAGNDPTAFMIRVTDGYFRALGVPLLQGRLFNQRDRGEAAPVVLVNQAMARRHWPNETPLGRKLSFTASGQNLTAEIVGVVGAVRPSGFDSEPRPEFYLHYPQSPAPLATLFVRTANDPATLLSAVKEKIREVNRNQVFLSVYTSAQLVDKTTAQRRFNLLWLGAFAVLALVLAAVGLYGLISFATAQRTQEIGVRMALGAQTGDVLKLVIKQGLSVALLGVGIGIVVAAALTRLMKSLLFGVNATDPLTFALIALLLLSVALLACYLPARRATKVDPLVALRHE
jgi:putative ABC transport system permease protein